MVLTACGSSSGDSTRSSVGPPPRPSLVKLEQSLEREYGVRNPECRSLDERPAHARYRCFVESHHIELRLSVTQETGRRGPVITGCGPAQREQDRFITCSFGRRR
jgi:hypothetical protein